MRLIKKLMIFIIVLSAAFSTVIAVKAETVYETEGYSFTIIDNNSVAIVGWDNRNNSIVIPSTLFGRNVVSIANFGLIDNTEISGVDFSQAVFLKRLGMYSFKGCTALNGEIVLPKNISSISDSAFQECSSIESIRIYSDIDEISNQCFYNCTKLLHVELPNSVKKIGSFAFSNCYSLEYMELGRNITEIAKSAFANDSNLTLGVWYNSYAHQYAKDNSIPYKLLDSVKLGDVNMDGVVNINDVTAIQRDLAMYDSFNELQKIAEDVNRDGVVNISDATTLQMFLAHKSIPYPIGQAVTQQ